MKGKWCKKGEEIYREARKNGWKLITKLHDGILMPEHWERKNQNGEWEFRDAYNGSGKMIGLNGEKIMKLW